MKRLINIFLLTIPIVFYAGYYFVNKNNDNFVPQTFSQDKLWSLIQDWRTQEGLQPYIKDQKLDGIAEERVTIDPIMDTTIFSEKSKNGYYTKYFSVPANTLIIEYPMEIGKSNELDTLNGLIHSKGFRNSYRYAGLACNYRNNYYCSFLISNL